MSEIPKDEVTVADIEVWYKKKQALAALQAEERLLRARIFTHFFPTPKEGTNNHTLPDNYVLKAVYPYTREVDKVMYLALRELKVKNAHAFLKAINLPAETLNQEVTVAEVLRLNIDAMVEWEPKLVLKQFRQLTAEQEQFFSQCVTTKPGSAQITVAEPSKRG